MINIFSSIKTTGTIPWKNGITEIAFLVEDNDRIVDQTFTKLNPGEVEFDPKALEVNEETIDKVSTQMPANIAYTMLTNFLNKYTRPEEKFMLVAYNAPFVHDFIMNFFKRNAVVNEDGVVQNKFFDYFYSPALDVMQIANFILKDIRPSIPDFQFRTVCEAFELPQLSNNSCINKARLTYMLYNKLTC